MRSLVLVLFCLISNATAHAESNEYNLHLGFGAYAPSEVSGLGGESSFAWQFKPGFALDFALSRGSGSSDAFGGMKDVADWLIAHGISRDQITVKGYGATMAKAANDSEEHRAMNRRIEFKRLH